MFKADKDVSEFDQVSHTPRSEHKRRWDRDNRWRRYDKCKCGNEKDNRSDKCIQCHLKEIQPLGWKASKKWREENPQEWDRIRKWLASGRGYY